MVQTGSVGISGVRVDAGYKFKDEITDMRLVTNSLAVANGPATA
jgi:hypothetical protein